MGQCSVLMMDLELSLCLGWTVWRYFEGQWPGWPFYLALVIGTLIGNPWILLWVGLIGWSIGRLREAGAVEAKRDRNQFRSEVFLQSLRHGILFGGGLSYALSQVTVPLEITPTNPAQVLRSLSRVWQSEPLGRLAQMAGIAERHGGSLVAVIDDLLRRLRRDRQNLQVHRAEESAQRAAIMVLAVTPLPLFFGFRLYAPTFYQIVTASTLGHWATTWIAMTSVAALELLRWQVLNRRG